MVSQCSGNRRSHFGKTYKKAEGIPWNQGGVSTARFSGVRLRDVLLECAFFLSHCNMLQLTATHCNTLQHTVTHCNTLQHTVIHCNTLQHAAAHCNTLVLWRAAGLYLEFAFFLLPCNVLHHATTHFNTLQHTATHHNMLQLTAAHSLL